MTTRAASTTPLPPRPRFAPGIAPYRRGGGELQIGLDPRRAVILSALPPRVADVLAEVDGTLRFATLRERVGTDHAALLEEVMATLAVHGLVEDAVVGEEYRTGVLAHIAVDVRGEGRIGVAVAGLLAAEGVGRVSVAADGVVTRHDLGTGYLPADVGRRRSTAAAEAVRRANPATATRALPESRDPDLVILTDAVVPCPETVSRLTNSGIAHLTAAVRDGVGVVGPLVLPRRSCCLRCADLHRAARDPEWPRVAHQLAGRVQRADACTAQAVAAIAVRQVLPLFTSRDLTSPLAGTTVEVDAGSATTRSRHWPPHPGCACGAA